MALNDGQVMGDGAIIKGLTYSPLNQLSNEPLFTFQRSLQAKILGRGDVKLDSLGVLYEIPCLGYFPSKNKLHYSEKGCSV